MCILFEQFLDEELDMHGTSNIVKFTECYVYQGDEFVNYLHAEYLPTLQISPQLIDEYCQALKAENKVFKNYVKVSGRNFSYFELISQILKIYYSCWPVYVCYDTNLVLKRGVFGHGVG